MTNTNLFIFDLGLRELTLQRLQAFSTTNDTTLVEAIDEIVLQWHKWEEFSQSEAFKNQTTLNQVLHSVDAANIKLNDMYDWVSEIKAWCDE